MQCASIPEMSSLKNEHDPKENILLAIANDDAEAVARLATNELKAEKIVCERTPDYAYTMGSFGILQAYGKTYHGLKLGGGQTLLDIAQSNNKQAAVGALLP